MDVSPDYSSITYRKNQAAIKFYHELSLDENDHDAALGDYLATDISIPNLQSSPVSISTKVPEVLECMNATSTLIDCEDKESERASMHSPKDSDFDFEVMSISGESCMDIAQSSTLTHVCLFLGNNHTRSGAWLITLEILPTVATILQMHTGNCVLLVHI